MELKSAALGTSLNTATKALLEVCAGHGISTRDLLNCAKLSPSVMEKFNGRIPADKKHIIWEEAFRRTGDERIGMRAAKVVPFGGYGVLDYLLFASSTLDEALNLTSRFYHLINSKAELRLQRHKNFILIELYNPSSTSRHSLGLSAEFTFSMITLRFRLASGQEFSPERVSLTHFLPSDISLHQKLFRSPIKFGQTVNRLVLNKNLLNAPLPQSDPVLAEMLQCHAQRLLRGLSAENDLPGNVHEVLRGRLGKGDISLEAIARTLGMSGRNLQRSLNGQGTSYRRILDGLRYELALDYIAQQVETSEITQLLGFSETSTFHRAFKRWSSD